MSQGPPLTRRAVVVTGAAAGGLALAGCTVASTGASEPATGPVAATSDIPVGGGMLFPERGVVVTQATEGAFAAFGLACPHQGCNVGSVSGDTIVCPCHGSTFSLDGAVQQGPATTGLTPVAISVEGDRLTLG